MHAFVGWAGMHSHVYWYVCEAEEMNLPDISQLLVYALGFISEPFNSTSTSSVSTESSAFQQAESCFSAAQKRMGILLSRTGIMEAQCFFLAGVYLMSILRPIEAWRMFVQAMACCQGFHTSNTADHSQIEDEQKIQNSIYWTCFKSEL
jgi:hypothetical protein